MVCHDNLSFENFDTSLIINPLAFENSYSDGRGPNTNPKESQISRHIGPNTRAMAKRLDEDWNTATNGRETYLYMFQEVQNQA